MYTRDHLHYLASDIGLLPGPHTCHPSDALPLFEKIYTFISGGAIIRISGIPFPILCFVQQKQIPIITFDKPESEV